MQVPVSQQVAVISSTTTRENMTDLNWELLLGQRFRLKRVWNTIPADCTPLCPITQESGRSCGTKIRKSSGA